MGKHTALRITAVLALLLMMPLITSYMFARQTQGKITVEKTVVAPYLLSTKKRLFLVFFGYVGCTKVCMPMLERLDEFYRSPDFHSVRDDVGVVFVNLMPGVDSHAPEAFARSFNPEFEGVYLDHRQLLTIDRDFRLFFARSMIHPDEIDHSDFLYLVEKMPDGELRLDAIYHTRPLNTRMVVRDVSSRLDRI